MLKMLPKLVREETIPEIPWNIRIKAGIFGKRQIIQYLWNYYQEESESRIPFYIPYLSMRRNVDLLRRYAEIPKKQLRPVLIDGGDQRIDYFLYEFMEEINFLTIITSRKEYFESLQERVFQESGLIMELILPWEAKHLTGNLVWDFSENLQSEDCYPYGSICFLPHKKRWKLREVLQERGDLTVAWISSVEIGGRNIPAELAESFLSNRSQPFRNSRCMELEKWCRSHGWEVKISIEKGVENPEKP